MGEELELFIDSFFHTESFHYLFYFLSFFSRFCFCLKKPDPPAAGVNEILPLTMKEMKSHPLRNHYSLFFFFLLLLQSTVLVFHNTSVYCFSLQLFPHVLAHWFCFLGSHSGFTTHSVFLSTKEIGILLYKQVVCWIWCNSNHQLSIQ